MDSLTGTSTATNANNILSISTDLWYLGNSSSITGSLSSQITNAIHWVSDGIESDFKHKVVVQELFGFYNSNGGSILFTNNYPIQSITSLMIRTSVDNAWEDITSYVDESSIGGNSNKIILKTTKSFYCGINTVKLHYTAGYNPVPADIKQLAIERLAITLRESQIPEVGKNLLGISSKTIGTAGVSDAVQYISRLTKEHEKIVEKYKMRSI
jgi:hypothetical protein